MTTIQLCRICLAHDSRMYTMNNQSLQEFYLKMANKSFNIEGQRPSVVCYICYHSLKKYHRFTKNAIKADEALQLLNKSGIQKTEQFLSRKQTSFLFMALTTSPITNVNVSLKVTEVKKEENEDPRIEDGKNQEQERIVNATEIPEDMNKPTHFEIKEQTSLDERGTEGDILSAEETLQLHELHHSSDIDDDLSVDGIKLEEDDEVDKESSLEKKRHRNEGAPGPKRRNLQQPTTSKERLEFDSSWKQNTTADKIITRSSDVKKKLRNRQSNRNNTNKKRCDKQKSDTDNITNDKKKGKKPFKSNNSGNFFTKTSHSKTQTDIKPLACKYCKKELSNKGNLARHLKLHEGEKQHKCDICEKKFMDKRYLKSHLNIHTKAKPFQCSVCGKTFADRYYFSRHSRRHNGGRLFECDYCGKKFTEKHHLKTHITLTDGHMIESFIKQQKDKKQNICNYCGKRLSDKRYLSRHLRIHTGEKPFKCEHCDKKFTVKHHLTRHLTLHKDGKSFTCADCGNKFTKHSSLITHLKKHTNGKPLTCDYCKRNFRSKSFLTRHIRTHTGEKPFQCDYCEKRFRIKDQLKRHIICIHMGKRKKEMKKFECDNCGKRFISNYQLARHCKVHTGQK